MIKANRRNFLFEEVRQTAPERNGFDLSHENKQTCRAGKLYPFEILETLPNDDFQIQVEQFIRLNPMLSPTMHRVKAYWHWIFTPARLTWKYWEEFISRGNGKKLPETQEYTPPEPPQISLFTLLVHSPSIQLFANDPTTGTTQSQDYADQLQAYHPEVIVKFVPATGTAYGKSALIIYARVPRLANALQIPDTALPLLYAQDGDNSFHWVENGGLTVNDLLHYDGLLTYNPDTDVDVLDYYKSIKLSLMPFTAAFRNWTEYYRDENLDDDYVEMLDYLMSITGEVETFGSPLEQQYLNRLFELNFRCWEKDYFTTATTLPQKAPDVLIPGTGSDGSTLTATTSISGDGDLTPLNTGIENAYTPSNQTNLFINEFGGMQSGDEAVNHTHSLSSDSIASKLSATTSITSSGSGSLQPTTVAQVRRAFALQRWFEKVVRTGTRYIESLKAFFNSDAGDARLQRSEYIGGMSTPIQISDVVQTSATDDNGDTVQGNLAGYGIASDNSEVITYHAPEHGFIIGYFSILARTSYSQGIPKLFSRDTWLDYAWPEFEHIGEQGIRNKELAAVPLSKEIIQPTGVTSQSYHYDFYASPLRGDIFGYQSRYSEYKQIPDRFGSGFSSSLDFWSLGRIFGNYPPTLSKEFVHANISDRNFAIVGRENETPDSSLVSNAQRMDEAYDYDTYVCDFWLDIKKVTSLTLYSEPI